MSFLRFFKSRAPTEAATPKPATPPSPPSPPSPPAPAPAAPAAVVTDAHPLCVAARDVPGIEEIAAIADPRQLAQIALDGATSKVRQLAALRIDDPELLRQLLKQTRGKDKSVYKIVKDKTDALRADGQRAVRIDNDIRSLCEALERHAARRYDVLYPTSLKLFEERWRTLEAGADAVPRARALAAIEDCRRVIEEHARELAAQEAGTRARALEAERQTALVAARLVAAELDAKAAAERLQKQTEAADAEAAKAAALSDEAAPLRAAETRAVRQLGALIASARRALREGHTGRAAGLRRAIQEKLDALPGASGQLTGQLQQLDAALDEMRGWKDYVVAPKRTELIEQMEALIGASEAPQALAERIKLLQAQWQTISRGVTTESDADWQRFQEASAAAYAPCRAYFEAQAELRRQNLAARRAILERLVAFEAALAEDEREHFKAIAAVLREAPREWRRHVPVERAAAAVLHAQYEAIIARLQARLDAWHAANATAKAALIERAGQLLGQDAREAVDAVKRLQLQWKEIGPAARAEEGRAWEEFRKHCDAVFDQRQQVRSQHLAALETNEAAAEVLIRTVEEACASTGAVLLEQGTRIAPWRAAFAALGELPRTEERALRARWEKVLDALREAISRQQARDQAGAMSNMLEGARLIQEYGYVVAKGGEGAADAKQAAEEFIAGVPTLPPGAADALREAWAQAARADGASLAAAATALRLLCIRAEIVSDRPTPAEDLERRREYQLQRLVRHLSDNSQAHAHPGSADSLASLALEWARTGPAPRDRREALLRRFSSAITA